MRERFPDVLVEKVSYKGFIHCDNQVREPNKTTIEGIHDIFASKKKVKQAQSDNPLACRGFKKAVIMTVTKEGFRLDMLSSDQEGSLFHALTPKILYATCIEKHIYVITKRSSKPGKYACHCIKGEVKDEGKVNRIARFIHETAQSFKEGGGPPTPTGPNLGQGLVAPATEPDFGSSPGGTKRRMSIMDDDAAAADLRSALVNSDGTGDTVPMRKNQDKGSQLQDYLGPVRNSLTEDDLQAMSISDFPQLQAEAGDETAVQPLSSKDKILEAMMWYHGAISRDVADQMLMGKPAGTYIVRFSSTKNEYCISLVNQQNAVQHFATVSNGPKLALHGHKNQYASVIELVDHYTRHDITSQGDRCTTPCSGKTF
jgi:hypothetical protein